MTIPDSEIRTKGSLCTGTGMLDVATPGEVKWVAESAEEPCRILKRDHSEVPNLKDITAPDFVSRAGYVDLLTSGDPCQSMSEAGKRLGPQDPRFLWPHVRNIVREIRPRVVFLENVRNLVGIDGGAVLRMRLDDLRDLGYAARWTVLGACAVGAPHHRHRWFLRADHVGANAPEAVHIVSKCGAPRSGGRLLLPSLPAADGSGGPGTSPKRTGGMNLRTAVHHLLPTPRATDVGTDGRRSSEGWRPQLGQAVRERWGDYAPAVALWEATFGRPAPPPLVPAPKGGQRLNPALAEWMMGMPAGHVTAELERNAALRAIGNGVVPQVAWAAWELLGGVG